MRTERLRPLIDASAAYVALPPWQHLGDLFAPGEWLEGLILHESDGDPRAIRYEKQQDLTSAVDGDTPGTDDGLTEDDSSYGLMQVMGYNARAICGVTKGVPMNFGFLLKPVKNLGFGLEILTANLSDTLGRVEAALARFNGGTWGNPPIGELRNQNYVDAVAKASARAQLARAVALEIRK